MDYKYLKSLHSMIIDAPMQDSADAKELHSRISKMIDSLHDAGKLSFHEADDLHCLLIEYSIEYSFQHFCIGFAMGNSLAHESENAVHCLLNPFKSSETENGQPIDNYL